jgi:hypothetical protein
MTIPTPHTAEEADPVELWRASLRLLFSLVVLAGAVLPLILELPVGQTTRTGLLAWLLVAMAFYWLWAGLGYRPLLLIQLLLFSSAAFLLTTKAGLVLIGINRLSVLRRSARNLIIVGALCAVINLVAMLVALVKRRRLARRSGPG